MAQSRRDDWAGSLPELLVFNELLRRGYQPNVDFWYQAPIWGGRHIRGGFVIDFWFMNPPGLAVNVQGEYWHHEQGAPVLAVDSFLRSDLAAENITLIFIDEDDILRDVRYYVGEALQFRDHSRLG